MEKDRVKDLDELWDSTEGSPICPKCGSPIIYGHIREINIDLALVDWTCEKCGFKWSLACPFEDGCMSSPDGYPEDLWL